MITLAWRASAAESVANQHRKVEATVSLAKSSAWLFNPVNE